MEKESKKKCNSLSIKQKLQILKLLGDGKRRKDICAQFKCSEPTLTRIIKNKHLLHNFETKNLDLNRKRDRSENARFICNGETEDDEIMLIEPLPDIIEDFADIDDEIPCWGISTDDDIIKTLNKKNDTDSEDDDCEIVTVKPMLSEALNSIQTLKAYFSNNETCVALVDELYENLSNINFENLHQSKIEQYFKNI